MNEETKEDQDEESDIETIPMNFNGIVQTHLVNAPMGPRSQRIANYWSFLTLVYCETNIGIPEPPNILIAKRQFQQSKYGRILSLGSPENEDDEFSGEFDRIYRRQEERELHGVVQKALKILYDNGKITFDTFTQAGGFIPVGDEEGNIIGERKMPRRI